MRVLLSVLCCLFAVTALRAQETVFVNLRQAEQVTAEQAVLLPTEPMRKLEDNSLAVAQAQEYLFDIGYQITNIDGIFGEETRSAIIQFQTDYLGNENVPGVGEFTLQTLQALRMRHFQVEIAQHEGSLTWGALSISQQNIIAVSGAASRRIAQTYAASLCKKASSGSAACYTQSAAHREWLVGVRCPNDMYDVTAFPFSYTALEVTISVLEKTLLQGIEYCEIVKLMRANGTR